MKYSKYQQEIFKAIDGTNHNLIIEAVAGSGKTTTIVEGMPKDKQCLFVAFNKHIATELSQRTTQDCRTLHSVGYNLLGNVKVNGYKVPNIAQDFGVKKKDQFNYAKVISLHKSMGFYTWDNKVAEGIIKEFDVDPFDYSLGSQIWAKMIADKVTIDFDDMIFLPVLYDLDVPKYDCVFIDEAQDLSYIQQKFIEKFNTRTIAVGDTNQAIYGFRGADSASMVNMKKKFSMKELPLSICYRCKSSIVEKAQKIVPHMEYYQKGGSVSEISTDEFRPEYGDYVLCRTTAPLVSECLKQIAKGNKAIVKGKSIGDRLKSIVNTGDIDGWYEKSIQREISPGKRMSLDDIYDTLKILEKESNGDMIGVINKIFTENSNGIIFSTIHKSKGLEANTIYIIKPELIPHPKSKMLQQEKNLHYVAITRAKERLVYVK